MIENSLEPVINRANLSAIGVAYERRGDSAGWPVVLLHGFPYDVRCYDEVAHELAGQGANVIMPYLRGFGPTTFRSATTIRSGQQTALAHDLIELIDELGLEAPIVAGFDWGGRAACVASMLWPDRVGGLVTVGGYNVHDIAAMASTADPPAAEARIWYQWYFHSERGRAGLTQYKAELTRQLWSEWSPGWAVPEGAFEATVGSFDNADFVSTVVHSYRHRYGLVAGDPAYERSEAIVATKPAISVPTVVLDPTEDPVLLPRPTSEHAARFSGLVRHERVATGHNTPQEDPGAFSRAVLAVHTRLLETR